jgi:MFS family permease
MNSDPRLALREKSMTFCQMVVVVICVALNMVDGFDVLAVSFTAPLIAREWNVDPATLGLLFSAGLAGMGVGALCISPIADVMGRRFVLILSTVMMSVGMLLSAATSNVLELSICRVLTGLGVGGVLASGNTLIAEYAPTRWRDLVISTMVVGYSAGAIIGGSISAYLISAYG